MPTNNPDAPSRTVAPRLRVLTGGMELPVALSAEVTQTNNFHGDRFRVRFAPPRDAGLCPLPGVGSFAWWGAQTSVLLNVQFGIDPSPARRNAPIVGTSLIVGQVDDFSLDPDGWTVTAEGRDLTARFIDHKTEAANVNQTASEIVAALARKEGLTPVVTPTTTPVGTFYQLEHVRTALDQFSHAIREWDEIVQLARFEGFDAFVQGTSLYFQPRTQPAAAPYSLVRHIDAHGRPSGNLLSLRLNRSLTIARGVHVVVRSWHGKQARGFTRGAPSFGLASAAENVQQYVIVRPNLTEDQAQQLANQTYAEIVRHEKRISGQVPGDLRLTPRVMLRLSGTGTAFDQAYYPDTIMQRIDGHGFVTEFTAKNHDPQTQVTAG